MIEDKTGDPISDRDLQDAIDAIKECMIKHIMNVPPQLGVNLSNIHRCLVQLQASRAMMKLMSGQ